MHTLLLNSTHGCGVVVVLGERTGSGGGGDGSKPGRREKVSFSSKKSLVRQAKAGEGQIGARRIQGPTRW